MRKEFQQLGHSMWELALSLYLVMEENLYTRAINLGIMNRGLFRVELCKLLTLLVCMKDRVDIMLKWFKIGWLLGRMET